MIRSLCFGAAFLAAGTAGAQENWEFRVTPNLWTPSFEANATLPSGEQITSEGEVLDYLAAAFLIAGEARRGPLSIFGEYNYLNLSDDLTFPASLRFQRIRIDGSFGSIAAGYAFFDQNDTRLEAFAGARIWDLDTDAEGLADVPLGSLDFTDAIVGLRGETRLSEKWGLRGTVDIGGFGLDGSSDFQTEVIVAASYDFTDRFSGVLGYRYLKVDLPSSPGGSLDDISFFGPLLALDIRF